MKIFLDTSAVVPILLGEGHSKQALAAWSKAREVFAWSWMAVETEAALSRRKADSQAWSSWKEIKPAFGFIGLTEAEYPALCAFNRSLGLRSADAGHLFVFDRLLSVLPDARLLTFDSEMQDAAKSMGFPIYQTDTTKKG